MKADFSEKFSGKNKIGLIILISVLICLLAGGVYLATRGVARGENPIKQVNENRSQILVTGEKYALSYEQEQEYIEQEKKREEIRQENKEKIEEQSGISSNTGESESDIAGGESRPGEGSGGNEGSGDGPEGGNVDEGQDKSKLPKIETTLQNGQQVSGDFLSFNVKATSYKNVVISSFDMYVTINGTRVTSSGTSASGWVTFKDDGTLVDGANTIVIKATDPEGYTSKVTYIVNVDKNGERPIEGTATVTVDAPSIGLGTLFTKQVTVYKGENVASVMMRTFENTGYTASFTGSVNHAFYLAHVRRPGILNGWNQSMLHPKVKAHLEEINASYMGFSDPNSLGQKNLYEHSGWVVAYNGIYGDGMSTVACYDEDEIRLSFTVHFGYEYDGTWADCNL